MASPLEIFEAAVYEAVHEALSVADGDGLISNLVAGLAEVVDGLTFEDAALFLAPAMPRLVEDHSEDGTSFVVNDIWYRNDTFGPAFYALAREFYDRVRPESYPSAPVGKLGESDEALFGCELTELDFPEAKSFDAGRINQAGLLWAGCVVSSVKLHFSQPIALALSYSMLFNSVQTQD